jgi:glycosyltransferase involved in cell wall biosynthesis
MALPTVEQGRAPGAIPNSASNTRTAAARSPSAVAGVSNASVALVHDWCPSFRGGERVLAELCRMFNAADVFTLFDFLSPELKAQFFPGVSFHTSIANQLPLVHRYYRALFSVCPFLIEQFDVTSYDAVVSSSAAFARGVLTRPDQPHVCYVHTPVRYAWDEQFSYLAQARLGYGPRGVLFRYLLHRLRTWDARTAHGPDLMLANSNYVRLRIKRVYGRDATVVYPPVSMTDLQFEAHKDDYYIATSSLAPNKRADLVIKAFREMRARRLIMVGEGYRSKELRALAGPNVIFAGYLPRPEYVRTLAQARAMVFAGCEDFGITMAEAQACGTPIIAFARGGALDIVHALGVSREPTGVLFKHQSTEAIKRAVEHFEMQRQRINANACRHNAGRFSVARFEREMTNALETAMAMHGGLMASTRDRGPELA